MYKLGSKLIWDERYIFQKVIYPGLPDCFMLEYSLFTGVSEDSKDCGKKA